MPQASRNQAMLQSHNSGNSNFRCVLKFSCCKFWFGRIKQDLSMLKKVEILGRDKAKSNVVSGKIYLKNDRRSEFGLAEIGEGKGDENNIAFA